jgi:hypothetical protein
VQPTIGGYVGTVETPAEICVFATNPDLRDEQAGHGVST